MELVGGEVQDGQLGDGCRWQYTNSLLWTHVGEIAVDDGARMRVGSSLANDGSHAIVVAVSIDPVLVLLDHAKVCGGRGRHEWVPVLVRHRRRGAPAECLGS